MKLENWRKEIDEIDGKIVLLLNRRAKAAQEIGKIKAKAGLPIIDLERESAGFTKHHSAKIAVFCTNGKSLRSIKKFCTNRDRFRSIRFRK